MVAGGATISSAGATTTIQQSTDRAVIHWQGFSIAPGETTSFVQPAASSVVLNRVTSGNASQLMGTLQANGQVYLLNPNGIFIGNGAVIDVGSFLATTHHTDEDAFMRGGELTFTGPSTAGIRNEGKVRANGGDVYLLARKVENEGEIVAEDGTVGLMAGTKFYLRGGGGVAPAVRVELEEDVGEGQGTGVKNTGLIRAAQARLEAAGNLYSLAVSQRGLVQATGTKERADGKIILSAPGGKLEQAGTLVVEEVGRYGSEVAIRAMDVTLDPSSVITASGREGGGVKVEAEETVWVQGKMDVTGSEGKGGKITVTGARVGLREAQLDASGAAGGGEILLGGDFQGKNPAVRNAERAFVSADSVIRADAVVEGDGGKVITWSDEGTLFYGEVSARGGAEGGDGGLVEVSGRDYLDFQGLVDTRAPMGQAGMLLLDPFNLTINDVGPDALVNSTTDQPFYPIGSPSVLTWQVIENALGSGNVTVTTVGTPVPNPAEDGNITTADARTLVTSGNDLFLVANGSIDLAGGGLVLDGGGSLFLQALGNLGNGDITIGQAVTVNNGGGLFMEAGGNILFNGLVTINNGGDLSARSTDLTGSEITDTAGRSISGATTLHAGRINLDSASQYTGAVDIIARGSGSGGPAVQIVSADNLILGNVEITDTGTFVVPAAATVSQLSGEAVVIGGALFVAAGGGRIGNVTLNQELNDFNSLQVLLGTQLTVTDRDSIALAATTLSGNLTVTAGGAASAGAITQTGVLNIGGTSTLAAFGNVDLSNEGNGFTGQVVVTRADNLSLGNLNALDLRVDDSVVDLTLSVGDIGFAAPVTATGVVTFQGIAPETAISLNNPAPAAGELNLGNADLSAIAAGASRFVFGRSDQTGDLTVFTGAGPVTSAADFRAGTGAFTVNSNLTVQGAMTVTADTVTFSGGNDSVTVAGAVTLQPFTPARTIGINPNASVDINYTGVPNIFSGETAFVFGRSDQTGAYDVGATTFQVPVTLRTANNLGQVGLRGTLRTTGSSLDIQGNLVLGDDADLISGGTLSVSGDINGAFGLDLSASGITTLGGDIGDVTPLTTLTTSADGITRLQGPVVTTTGNQTYQEQVVLLANTTMSGSTPAFAVEGLDGGGFNLTLNFSGTTTIAGDSFIRIGSLTSGGGGTTVLSGNLTTAGSQTFSDDVELSGTAVTLSGSVATFQSNLNSSLTAPNNTSLIVVGAVSFASPVGGANTLRRLSVSGATTVGAGVELIKTSGGQDYGSTITLNADTNFEGTQVSLPAGVLSSTVPVYSMIGRFDVSIIGNAIFNSSQIGSSSDASISPDSLTITGGSTFNGDSLVRTTGPQIYTGSVLLGGNQTLQGTIINFGGSVDSITGFSGSVSITGNTVFTGAIGDQLALGSVAVSGTSAINGGQIITTGAQSFSSPVTLGADTLLSAAGANITFGSTIENGVARALTVSAGAGTVTFDGAVGGGATALGSLAVTGGTIAVNGGAVSTTGAAGQVYTGAVTLGADTTLTTSNDPITFSSTIRNSAARALTILAGTGTVTFGGAVGGGATALGSLAVTGATIAINGGAVTTSGGSGQVYTGAVTLGADTTLTTSDDLVTFSSTIQNAAARALTIVAGTGTVTFGGAAGGGATALGSLAVTGATIAINGGAVTTSGGSGQVYTGAVTLGADTTLTTSNDLVTFSSTIQNGAARVLTVSSGAGTVTFGGAAGGGATALGSLAVTGVAGLTQLNGGVVTTSGAQTYAGAVNLGSDIVLTGTTFNLNGAVNGSQGLVVAGNASFGGIVGGVTRLSSLLITGTTALGAGTTGVTTTGSQTYGSTVTFGADTIIQGSGLTFLGNLASGGLNRNLSLISAGSLQLPAVNVGSGGSLAVEAGGTVSLTAAGALAYTAGAIDISASSFANLTGSANPFNSSAVTILTARPNGNSPSSLNGGFADFGYAFLPAPQVSAPGVLGTMVYRFFDAPGVATPLQYTETAQTFAYTAAVPVSTYAGPRPFAGEVRLGRIEGAAPTDQPGGTVEPMEDGEIPPPPTQLSRTKPKYGSPFAKVLITEREKAKAAEAQEKSIKSGVGRLKVSDTVQIPPAEIRQVDGERLTQLQNR